ncbi:MAG: glycosyltransferase family 2 protein [Roseburia sp.]
MKPEVTVIIPNYNGRELLKNCIKTLEKQTCRDFILLIVDNGSTDESSKLVSECLDLRWIKLNENKGFCGAVNIGIQNTETPYFILLNNDTEADKDFVKELLLAIKKSERIFSCGAQMLDYRQRELLDNAGDCYTALGWAVARGKGKPAERYAKACSVFSACAGAAIYRTDVARQIGLLDEMHFAYLEDVDLGYRARIYGFFNRYAPAAKVYHLGSATTGTRYNEKKVFLAARNSIFLVYKNMPMAQVLLNVPFLFVGILLKSLFFLKKGLAREYVRGICEGLAQKRKCKKVKFRLENLGNYTVIQIELWINMFRIALSK